MTKYILTILVVLFFSGCTLTTVSFKSNEESFSQRIYYNVAKDAVLEAGKKVFLLSNENSNNNEFVIDSYRNKIEVSKILFENRLINVDLYLDKWILEVQQFEKETRASIKLLRTDAVEQETNRVVPFDIYQIFWDRMDYLLGITNNWHSCRYYLWIERLDTSLCDNFFFADEPLKSDLIDNVLITQRLKNANTIDKIDSEIYGVTDLKLSKDYNNIFEQSENISEIKMLKPILDDNILEKEEIKVEVVKNQEEAQIEEVQQQNENNQLENDIPIEDRIDKENIEQFKNDLKNIVDGNTN